MAIIKGQLGAVDVPGSGVLTNIYTVPVSREASVNITIANRTDTSTKVRIAHIKNGLAAVVANEDYLMFDLDTVKLASHLAPISITGVAMQAGDTIAVRSSANAVSVQVNGIEGDPQ